MYLGRDGEFDGIQRIPVHKRLSMYQTKKYFRDNKYEMVNHMVGKNRLLDEYLKTGLRFIKWEI